MRLLSFFCLFLLALSTGGAFAQSNPGWAFGFVPTPSQWNTEWGLKADSNNTATGGTSSQPLADRAAVEFNVLNFGAKCDWNPATQTGTDDSAAFNAMTAAARATNSSGDISQPVRLISPGTRNASTGLNATPVGCYISSAVNLTGFIRPGLTVDFGFIHCAGSGVVCLDALGSRFISWNVALYGDVNTPPAIGIQIGRITTAGADDHNFEKVWMEGFYSQTALYNFASESTNYKGLYAWNRDTSTGYAVQLDGCNHFNVQSTFVTETLAVDHRSPMGGVTFEGAKLLNNANNPTVWIGCTSRAAFYHTYIAGTNPPAQIVALWSNDLAGNEGLYLDVGIEKAGSDCFLITGTYTTPVLNGFHLSIGEFEPTNSIFKLDTGITSANLLNAEVMVSSFFNVISAIPPLFDNPTLWTASGSITLPNAAMWTEPTGFSFTGMLCLPAGCVNYVPTPAINRNPEFIVNQATGTGFVQTAASNVLVIDGWHTSVSGSPGASITFAQASSTPPAQQSNYLSMITSVTGTFTAATQYSITSITEGHDFAQASFGNGGAQPITFDFCAYSTTTTGTFDYFLLNNGATRSYVGNYVIPAINTWYCFQNTIAGDTTGTWNNQRNRPGITIGFSLGAGSNFQTTPGTWQTGNFRGTAAGTSIGAAADRLYLDNVHLRIGGFHLPYQPRSYAQELDRSQHWYNKSFITPTQPAANAGLPGAASMIAPYAFSAGLKVGAQVKFPQTMYYPNDSTVPTITFFDPSAAGATCYDTTQTANAGAAAAVNTGDTGFLATCALVSGDAVGDQIEVQWTADSGG